MAILKDGRRTIMQLGLMIMLLIYLWLTYFISPAYAEIGNCHSYVYWRLTGNEQNYVTYDQLVDYLKKKLYRPEQINNASSPHISSKTGDVVIFGGATGHSGIALNDRGFSHMRGTGPQTVIRKDGSLLGKGGFFNIPTAWLSQGRYRDDIRNNEMAKIWYHQGASKHAIKQKFRRGNVGFYEPCSTVGEIYKRLPNMKNLSAKIWRQPTLLGIDPTEHTIFEDEIVHFTPKLYYDHLKQWKDAQPYQVNYYPTYVQNGMGTVLGSDAGVGTHEIYVTALEVPLRGAIAKLTVKERNRSVVEPCGEIVGTWRWFNGATVHFTYGKNRNSGTCTASNGFNGTWECTYETGGLFEIVWTQGSSKFIDTVNLVNDGKGLFGTNQLGGSVSATRE